MTCVQKNLLELRFTTNFLLSKTTLLNRLLKVDALKASELEIYIMAKIMLFLTNKFCHK